MKLQKIINICDFAEIEKKYSRKGCISNNYLLLTEIEKLIANGKFFVACKKNNAFVAVKKEKSYRIYYYLNDFSEVLSLDDAEMPYTTEVLFRGEACFPVKEKEYLESCGFKQHLVREHFEVHRKNVQCMCIDCDKRLIIAPATTKEEVDYAFNLFNETFDPYTGDYLSKEEIATFLNGNKLIIATFDDNLVGALHYEIKSNTIWIAHLAVEEKARGKHVAYNLVQRYIEMFISQEQRVRFALWVQQQNKAAKLLYQKFGFMYMNKSTVSFIKK